jgi:AsmA protein
VAIPVKLTLDLLTEPKAQPIHLAGTFKLTMEPDERYKLAAVDWDGTLKSKAGAIEIPWSLDAAELNVDLGKQTVAAPTFTVQFAAAKLSGSLNGSQIIDAPDLRGDFELQPVALRELLGQLGITPPVTRDATVLSKFAAHGAFGYSGDAIKAERLVVQLDDSALEGSASMNLETDAMGFDLSLDRADFDRYLPPPSKQTVAGKKVPFELPTDTLKGLRAKGKLAIGQAKIAGVALSALNFAIDAKEGMTRLAPMKAQLYGGQYSGDIAIDTRASVPVMKIEQTMTGIDVAQLLTALAETKRLSGRGNVSTSLTAQGGNSDALIKSLRGTMSANLADGAVEGLDLWYAINQAQSLIEKQTLAGGSNTGRTAFETFKASADVAGGVATTNDLNIVSQQLRVTGKGSANLATQAIDYQVTATVLKGTGGTLAAIPVGITGTFDNPKVRPDLQGIARERVKQEIDKHKDELKEKLGEKLKGFLGR